MTILVQYIEDILKNNYGQATILNKTNADCFIRIPKSSVIPQSIVAVPNIGRNIYLLPMPKYSYFRLKDAKSQISCFDCYNDPSKRETWSECEDCDGEGTIPEECECCGGSGQGNPIYKPCSNDYCDGGAAENHTFCKNCFEGEAPQKCNACKGKGHCGEGWGRTKCGKCNGHGTVIQTCVVCDGDYHQQEWMQCDDCGGAGEYQDGFENCGHCDGIGSVGSMCIECDGDGGFIEYCDSCDGIGVYYF